jgi:hypothetical protein
MDLYRIFKPVICISRVFCLAPFSTVEESGSTKYNFSVSWLTYSILGVCASFVFQINAFWFTESVSDAAVFNAINMLMLAASCLATVLTQILCLNNGKSVLRILDHVTLLDSEHSGARISYCKLYKMFIILLTYSIICLVVPNVMWFAALDKNSFHILKIVYYSTVYFTCDVVNMLSDTQFIHFVLLLKYRFSVLNHTVINLTVQSLYKMSLNHTITAPPADRAVNSSTSALSSSITLLNSTLRNVCRQHDSLCDISESVNRTYSIQIILSVTITSIELLYTAYNMSIEFSNSTFLNVISSTQFFIMTGLVGLFMGSSKVVLLIAACSRASLEVSGLHLWFACVCFLNTWQTE